MGSGATSKCGRAQHAPRAGEQGRGLGFRVLGFRAWGLGFGVEGLGFRAWGRV